MLAYLHCMIPILVKKTSKTGNRRREPLHIWRRRRRRPQAPRGAEGLQGLRPGLPQGPRGHLLRRVRRQGVPPRAGEQRLGHDQGQRLVPRRQRLCVVPRRAGRGRRVLPRRRRVDEEVDPDGSEQRVLLVGQDDRAVREGDLGRQGDAGAVIFSHLSCSRVSEEEEEEENGRREIIFPRIFFVFLFRSHNK